MVRPLHGDAALTQVTQSRVENHVQIRTWVRFRAEVFTTWDGILQATQPAGEGYPEAVEEDFLGRVRLGDTTQTYAARGMDNVFVERLWRTVNSELVCLHDYATPWALEQGLAAHFPFHNERRLHAALGYSTPAAVYCPGREAA